MSQLTATLASPAWAGTAFGISFAIATIAMDRKSLSLSGACAAVTTGVVTLLASWGWGLFLIFWFVLASLLSRVGRARKVAAMSGIVNKGDRRDAVQVLANGGLYAIAAGLIRYGDLPDWAGEIITVAGVASLVAAGADTWATEIGTLGTMKPWSLRERRRVPVGTSGAISLLGTLASAAGALLLALAASRLLVVSAEMVPAVVLGGFGGALADSLIGAWSQSRRWCPACQSATEQHVHSCGTSTASVGGIRLLDNDAVNFVCTACGALVASAIWSMHG